MTTKFLITGANGFVGKALCAELLRQGQSVRAAVRSANTPIENLEVAAVGSINGETDWTDALRGVDVVIHLAARAHVMRENAENPLEEFRKVNVAGTERLARMAAQAGVKRFVFLSSIKVNGEETGAIPFSEQNAPAPQDPYAISKWEVEQALHRIAAETGMEVVVLRCPLVYGPGVKGNFLRLMQAVDRGIPLPLALADNRRSLIYLGNLTGAIMACRERREAAGKTYLVSDGENVSTAQLITQMAQALGKPARLWPCPVGLIKFAGKVTGKSGEVARLLGSLCIDSSKIRRELGWASPYTLKQGLRETADWYRQYLC